MREPIAVERIERSSLERYISRREPAVISNLIEDWRALRRWSPLYFQLKYGRQVVTIERYPEGDFFSPWQELEMELREYLALLASPGRERYYLGLRDVEARLPKIARDFELPDLFPAERQKTVYLFLGVDSITGCHYHTAGQALLCQVVGKKRVILYPPEDFALLHPEPWYSERYNWSQINFGAPAPSHSSSLQRARAYEAVLNPGEALFIPLHWWHIVYGQELSISVTFFWHPELRDYHFPTPALRDLPREGLLRLELGLRALRRRFL